MLATATLSKPSIRAQLAITAVAFAGLYVFVVSYFAYVDVYNAHFFDPNYSAPYNLFRIVFAVYLFWIVYFSGRSLLAFVGMEPADVTPAERIALGFFIGAALWTLIMLLLGYLGLYTRVTALVLTVPIVAASSGHLLQIGYGMIGTWRNWRLRQPLRLALALIAVVFAVLLLIVKGLYPAGGHDYFTHYFYYFVAVLDHHNIWPNEVWYQYYYSKGMGLFFLGMLLTDPLAPSLVTYCFVVAAAIALFAFVERFNPGTFWPWTAVILFLAFYIYTPGSGMYEINGGWGDFQKTHETSSAFLFALLWASARFVDTTGRERRTWWFAAALCTAALAFITAFSSVMAGLFCCLMAAGSLIVRHRQNALAFFGLAVVAAAALAAVLALNYATTGLALDNAMELFWPILDLRRLQEWGVLPDVVLLMSQRLPSGQGGLPLTSVEMYDFVRNLFRAVFFPLFLLVFTAAAGFIWPLFLGLRMSFSRPPGQSGSPVLAQPKNTRLALAPIGAASAFLAATLCAAVAVGRTQPISFVRYTSFVLPLMFGMTAGGWQLMAASLPRTSWIRHACGFVLPVAVLILALVTLNPSYRTSFGTVVANSTKFVAGSASIYDGYINQSGWPGRGPGPLPGPDGAVRPWALAIWKELGPNIRFWTFGVHTYCMVPRCRPEAFHSFRMSPRSLNIWLGEPTEARAILQQEGLNYFLVEMDDTLRDVLLCSPLFSPDKIGDYLGIRWTDGTHFLLTWHGPGIEPLTPSFLEGYSKKVQAAPCGFVPLLQTLAGQVGKNPRWGSDLVMPWSRR